jgi:hypothetical protein
MQVFLTQFFLSLGLPFRKSSIIIIIRMDLGEVGWGEVDWIGLAQDRNR